MNCPPEFRAWLQSEMAARGWSYSETARRGGTSHARISQVLAGDSPGWAFCEAIATALGLPVDLVLRRAGLLPDVPADDAQWRRLAAAWEALGPADRQRLLGIAELWARE